MFHSISFTNLGIRPTITLSTWGIIVVICERIVGFVSLGLLVSITANKYARRAS